MNIKAGRVNKSKGMKAFGLVAGLLLLLLCANTVQSEQNQLKPLSVTSPGLNAAADSLDKETGLIISPGYTLVKTNCIRCHSSKLITDKRATREGWLATIRWMQQTQGLWNLGKAEPEILDYLAKNYAPTDEGRRPALKNIEWYKL
ncbi:MAG: hypothetical protein JWQ14_979 [Adhaeribacter sp.]|nr:hypothetical protein [Adhaeribacter sp.]